MAKVVQHIDNDQTFRYSPAAGDPMPIHLDEEVARDAGLPGIIAHGLCTMAFTSWAVLTELGRLGCQPAQAVRGPVLQAGAARRRPGNQDLEGRQRQRNDKLRIRNGEKPDGGDDFVITDGLAVLAD